MKRQRKTRRDLKSKEKAAFEFLFARLKQADSDDAPYLDLCLERAKAAGADLLAIRGILLDRLRELVNSDGTRVQRWRHGVEALHEGIQALVRTRRSLKRALVTEPAMRALDGAIELFQEHERTSTFVLLVDHFKPSPGRPRHTTTEQSLRKLGVSRDDARELMRAVRIAAPFNW